MKASTAILVLSAALAAIPAGAQETRPDYSREHLQRFFAEIPEPPPKRPSNIRFRNGGVEFRALGTTWRFAFVPLMRLSGTELETTRVWPDPFSLTNTPIASPPRTWRTQRSFNAERRRIEETERAKRKMKVGVNAK